MVSDNSNAFVVLCLELVGCTVHPSTLQDIGSELSASHLKLFALSSLH